MNILRMILVSLAGFVCTIAISGSICLLALHATILDRVVVKDWLTTSKVYDGRLLSALIQTPTTGGSYGSTPTPQPQASAGISVPPEAIKAALTATFTPDFVQAQTEGVVNNAYDWMEGKTSEFKFSIPIDQKRSAFIQQLSKAIEPQITALPVCQASRRTQQSTCRPPSVTTEQLSKQLATQSVDESGSFAAPITSESIAKSSQNGPRQPNTLPFAQLPAVRAGIDTLLIILPIAAIVSITVVIVATPDGRRLAASSRLSRRIFFAMLLTLIPAVAVLWIAKDHDLGLSNVFAAQIGDVVIPLIKTIIVGLSTKVALLSGIASVASVVSWIGLTIWRRKRQAIEAARVLDPIPIAQPVELPQQPQNFV